MWETTCCRPVCPVMRESARGISRVCTIECRLRLELCRISYIDMYFVSEYWMENADFISHSFKRFGFECSWMQKFTSGNRLTRSATQNDCAALVSRCGRVVSCVALFLFALKHVPEVQWNFYQVDGRLPRCLHRSAVGLLSSAIDNAKT